MKDEEIQTLIMKVVDGVASPHEATALAEAIRGDEKWETEVRAFRKIKEITDGMRFKELPDACWAGYWESMYRRLERGVGWILMSLGAIVLLSFGAFLGLSRLYSDPGVSLVVKAGVSAAVLGAIILLVSVLRERLFARRHERYEREVQR
jgi:hypothetical protein